MATTYVDFDSGIEEEGFSCRMLKRSVSVELEDASVPFDAIEWNVQNFVAAMQLCALASTYNFRIHCQREILQSFARICKTIKMKRN
jgi:hypothetical protein